MVLQHKMSWTPSYLNEASAGWRWPWPAAGRTPTADIPPQRWPSSGNFGRRWLAQSGRFHPPRCVLLLRGWCPCKCAPSLPESWAQHRKWDVNNVDLIIPCFQLNVDTFCHIVLKFVAIKAAINDKVASKKTRDLGGKGGKYQIYLISSHLYGKSKHQFMPSCIYKVATLGTIYSTNINLKIKCKVIAMGWNP